MTRIEHIRERLKWSQPEMAAYLGCSQPTISRLVNGGAEKGSITRLLNLLALEHGFDDLITPLTTHDGTVIHRAANVARI